MAKQIKNSNTKKSNEKKRRTREHIIADLSLNHFEKFAYLNGFTTENFKSDYGYDVNVFTYNSEGEFEIGNIYVQLKATDKLKLVNKGLEISFGLNKKDINTWINEPFPVILVIHDAKNDKGYWLYLQRYFEKLSSFNINTITRNYSVRIPVVNTLDKESLSEFRNYKSNVLKQIKTVIKHV